MVKIKLLIAALTIFSLNLNSGAFSSKWYKMEEVPEEDDNSKELSKVEKLKVAYLEQQTKWECYFAAKSNGALDDPKNKDLLPEIAELTKVITKILEDKDDKIDAEFMPIYAKRQVACEFYFNPADINQTRRNEFLNEIKKLTNQIDEKTDEEAVSNSEEEVASLNDPNDSNDQGLLDDVATLEDKKTDEEAVSNSKKKVSKNVVLMTAEDEKAQAEEEEAQKKELEQEEQKRKEQKKEKKEKVSIQLAKLEEIKDTANMYSKNLPATLDNIVFFCLNEDLSLEEDKGNAENNLKELGVIDSEDVKRVLDETDTALEELNAALVQKKIYITNLLEEDQKLLQEQAAEAERQAVSQEQNQEEAQDQAQQGSKIELENSNREDQVQDQEPKNDKDLVEPAKKESNWFVRLLKKIMNLLSKSK
jgi:hypothetical protein